VLDHRPAVDQRERFAGKPAGSESGGDESNYLKDRNRIPGVHDE
jgi:hypothetical protein